MFEKTDAANEYSLSIRISSDGFSLSVRDVENTVSLHKKIDVDIFSLSEKEIIDLFTAEKDILFSDYEKTDIIIETDNYTLVPKSIFNISDIDTYFYFQYPKDKKQLVIFNYINAWNTVNIFSLPVNLQKALDTLFPENEIKHQSSYLLSEIIKYKEDHIYVWKRPKSIDLVLIKNSELTLASCYSYQTTEDAVYYILRAVQEFKFDTDKTKISLYQRTLEEDLHRILLLYVKYCKIVPQQ